VEPHLSFLYVYNRAGEETAEGRRGLLRSLGAKKYFGLGAKLFQVASRKFWTLIPSGFAAVSFGDRVPFSSTMPA
jgi:hypothetical protein